MINAITEHFGNEAQWATLHQATVTLSDMGDRTISTQVRIDGDHVPNFSNWWLEFKGEKFILPIRDPQALKDYSSRNSIIDLTFYSWATYQMKRFFFMSLSQISANVAIPNKYNASIVMPVENFVELFNKVLRQYFGNKIRMDLYNMGQGYYSNEPIAVEINNTYIWDVLIKFYELFNLRWRIVYEQATDTYAIKVNYPAEVLADHDFEYGYEGGLLRFERQVQDDDIRNILLGRGGERNLPYRYFKLEDEAAGSVWAGDPDAIPELSNIYFERLRDINFRWYVRGWMHNPNRDTSGDEAWDPGHVFPTYEISDTDPHYWAYQKGLTDLNFDPVEYEKDDESIAKFGERWGALDDNDDIYPTIQGVEVTGLGRIDEICGVSDIITDDIDAAAKSAATEVTIGGAVSKTVTVPQHGTASCDWTGDTFTVPAGSTGILTCQPTFSAKPRIWHQGDPPQETYKAYIRIEAWSIEARDENGNSIISTNGTLAPIPAGTYRLYVTSLLANDGAVALETTFTLSSPVLTTTLVDADAWKPTFDIWVKNIWQTEQGTGETDAQYATRVWEKILGDRAGNEAKVVFSDGFMSLSEDYNFVIASYPVVDRSKTLPSGVRSEWKITLYKSDAEYDATGKFIPNADASAKPVAGDHFFFTGIDMPHQYVIWAEERINQNKVENLDEIKDINPSWVIGLDKVRVHTQEAADQAGLLADRLAAGTMITIKDRRFTNNQQLSLYIQTLTYTWQEPTQDSPYLVPDIEVVLSDKVVAVGSPVEKLNNDVSVIRSTYAKVTDIEDVVRRVATPLFLKKTGESDLSESPTSFGSAVRSKSFRQGAVGGEGWGHYLDGEGYSVLELDKLVVRQELQVNSLVANQISSVGGREILSAASMQCIQVVETDDSYICYFDQRRGTVANLFRVGDFAMGQQFDPDNSEQRYYRARVTAVDSDSITLSKAVKAGAGVPVVGDTIVQYGSDTDSSRQYVIVRDVIGGGYERMISGLTTVNAAGTEYYFAGRQNGSTPRWFVGDSNGEYAEWQNGILNIKGRVSVRKSDGSYQAMDSYIAGINSSLVNLQDQIDGAVQTWAGNVAPTLNNYPASAWTDTPTRNNHLGDLYYDTETGHGYRFMYTEDDGFFWFQLTDEDVTLALAEAARANAGVAGLQYLKTALADGTTIVEGGLVLTNLIQLGKTENGVFNVYSGINGLVDTTARGNGIAAWYGGPMADKEATPTPASYAKSLFRFDGSGYLASGNIGWDASGAGHIPGISWQGNSVIISGDVKLASLSGDSVTELLTLVRNLNDWFGEDANGNIYVKKDANNNPRNFYSFGGVTAFGVNGSGGGGGGGIDIDRVWQSLTNNPADPDYQNTKIALEHIPIGNGFTQRTVSGVTYFDADIRSVVKGTAVAGGAVSTANGVVTIQFPSEQSIIDHARNLLDADDLFFKRSEDEGRTVTISDTPGVTGTVLWGAEDANQVTLSVNGMDKALLKPNSIAGIKSSISTLSGNISALNTRVNGLVTGVSSVAGKTGAVALVIADIAGLTSALANKLEVAVTSLGGSTGAITLGSGLTISGNQLSVTGQTQGTVTRVDVGSSQYSPDANGVVGLPAYPTTLPASDVYSWAKQATKPSYNFSEIGNTPDSLAGYGIGDAYIEDGTIHLGGASISPLTSHQAIYAFTIKDYSEATQLTYTPNSAAGSITLTKSIVGLSNVTNDAQVKRTEMGAALGVATLGSDGKIPSSQLPSYVDDVLEYASTSAFPASGESGKIYVALDTNKTYRWSGTTYTEISPSIVIGTTTGTAFDGGSGYAHVNNTNNPHSVTKAQVGLGSVDNLAASGYFTLLENDNNQISVTIGGTNKKLTVAYASNAGTLEGHAASYFATATDLSSLSGRVSTLEGKNQINWDEIFGIDSSTGAVYVKKQTVSGVETARDFYSYGGVSAFGTGGSGGGSNIDLPRMWQALMNTQSPVADSPTNLIAVAHIPDLEIGKITGLQTVLNGKQAVISDLADIRAGAALGATAVQTETDPTVPAWAKNQTLQVADVPTLTTAKISDIETWIAGKGYLTGFDVEDDSGHTLGVSGTLIVNGGSNVTVDIDNGRLLISATDTTYSDATTSASGLMSATDKGRLDAIYAKVPAAAYNAGNEIADKVFVNSSIATATATYQGNYNVVTDLSLAYNASHSEIEIALDSLLVNVDDNDYCFVEIPVSGDSGAPIGRTERYKFNGTNWSYEYALNNSGFTANQWAAINSGITSALVTAFGNKYDKPSGGIPKSDLASAVQTSLNLADSALQSTYELTIKNSAGTTVATFQPDTADEELQLTKAMVGLGNVENTALSTWGGSQNITTLGTIATGVWHGTAIGNEYLALDMSWVSSERSVTHDEHDYVGYTAN